MKLVTKAIEKKLEKYPIRSQELEDNPIVVVKFFAPVGSWTWLVTEAERLEDGDWEFFGWVKGDYSWEAGYFRLSELESVRLPFGLKIERDLYFGEDTRIKEVIEEWK